VYSGKKLPAMSLLKVAEENKHRGSKDGFGFIDVSRNKMFKTILEFDHIWEEEVDARWLKKNEKIKMEKELKRILTHLNSDSEKWIMHHRKASVGGISYNNTHPIKIGDALYVHNGSVEGLEVFRNYMELFYDKNYSGTTDSEVIADFVETRLSEGTSAGDIVKEMESLFNQWGNLVRFEKGSNKIIIFKDYSRTFFRLKFDDSVVLISEPIITMVNPQECCELGEGAFEFDFDNGLIKPFGEATIFDRKKEMEILSENQIREKTCDCCNRFKPCGLTKTNDVCLLCLLTGEKPKKEYYSYGRKLKPRNEPLPSSFAGAIKIIKEENERLKSSWKYYEKKPSNFPLNSRTYGCRDAYYSH